MYSLERVRENTAYYLSMGRCPKCGGANPVEKGFKRCRPCAVKQAQRRQRYITEGRCSSCGGIREDSNYKTCRKCIERTRAYIAAHPKKKPQKEENK